MKEKRGLFNVSILVLATFVVGFGLTPYAMAHEITNIGLSPSSPAALLNNDDVNIVFDYNTTEAGGVRIYARPFTNGSLTPSYSAHSSPLYSSGGGSGTGDFTITTGDVVVDQIRFQMKNADRTVLLWETFIDVEYHFGNSITNINLVPSSPAQLMVGQSVTFTFDYVTQEVGGARIFGLPYTNGLPTPGYSYDSSPPYYGAGSDSRWFKINIDNERVDQIRFTMLNYDQSVLLLEFFIDVDYHICDGTCVWYVDADAVGTGTGHTWGNAFNELQDALATARDGDEIWVAEGTYKPDQGAGQTPSDRSASFGLINEVGVYGGFDGTETIRDQRDWLAHETILSGEIGNGGITTDNSYHVVLSASNDATAILDGFTISGGYNVGEAFPDYVGAGMLVRPGGAPTVSNCLFTDNTGGAGGGLGAWSTGSPSLFNCIFLNNRVTGGGGAVSLQNSSPMFRSCMFLGNSAGSGGGIHALNNQAAPILSNCVFSGNTTTTDGGAIVNAGTGVHYPPELTNCSINENSAAEDGGGIYNYGGDDVTLNSCILWGNSDTGGTGESAQFFNSSGAPTIQYSCLQGWTGGWGGLGNIGDDPMFVDADGADDVVGTEDDDVHLLEGSPCIDTGHPAVQYLDIDGSRNDMGAYGGPFGEITEPPLHTGTGFIITNIGVLPTTEIGRDPNDPNVVGLANVDPNASALFGVPQYKDSPFGGTLRVRGQFGPYDDVDFYQIMLGKWVDGNEPNSEDYVVLGEEKGALQLGKVRWYVDVNDHWQHEYVRMGPKTIDGNDYLYQFNRPLDESIWSNPDLRIRWNTRVCENGLYTLTYKAYRWADPCETTLVDANLPSTDGWDHIILRLDNNPVTATIHNVKYDPCSPYYYDPCDGEIEECAIINLTDPNENLRFTITATHPTGYLRKWVLDALYGKNKYAGVIASDSYTPVSPPYWDGVHEQEFQSEDSVSLDPWQRCAYQFRLRTWARTTNGTNYVYYDIFSDHYYLDFGGSTCLRADIDGSGFVDFRDVARLAHYWLATCGP